MTTKPPEPGDILWTTARLAIDDFPPSRPRRPYRVCIFSAFSSSDPSIVRPFLVAHAIHEPTGQPDASDESLCHPWPDELFHTEPEALVAYADAMYAEYRRIIEAAQPMRDEATWANLRWFELVSGGGEKSDKLSD